MFAAGERATVPLYRRGHLFISVHLGSIDESVKMVITRNRGRMQPRDVNALSAFYPGGTQLPDVTVITPVFAPDKIGSWFTSSLAAIARKSVAYHLAPSPADSAECPSQAPETSLADLRARIAANFPRRREPPGSGGEGRCRDGDGGIRRLRFGGQGKVT